MDEQDRALPPSEDRAVVNGAGQAVSALRASVPSAVPLSTNFEMTQAALSLLFRAIQNDNQCDQCECVNYNDPNCICMRDFRLLHHTAAAQAIEARRAETGTGSVHESAVPKGCAQ